VMEVQTIYVCLITATTATWFKYVYEFFSLVMLFCVALFLTVLAYRHICVLRLVPEIEFRQWKFTSTFTAYFCLNWVFFCYMLFLWFSQNKYDVTFY
jgi:hypothetical protein